MPRRAAVLWAVAGVFAGLLLGVLLVALLPSPSLDRSLHRSSLHRSLNRSGQGHGALGAPSAAIKATDSRSKALSSTTVPRLSPEERELEADLETLVRAILLRGLAANEGLEYRQAQ